MTANQISYWNLMENSRSNLAKEAETNRANVAKEREELRSNQARERENLRHNLETEDVAKRDIREKERTGEVTRPITAITGITRSFKDATQGINNVVDTFASAGNLSKASTTRKIGSLPNEYHY